jgi:hypothetical protein
LAATSDSPAPLVIELSDTENRHGVRRNFSADPRPTTGEPRVDFVNSEVDAAA